MDARFPLLQLKHHGVRTTGENQTNHVWKKREKSRIRKEGTKESEREENHPTTRWGWEGGERSRRSIGGDDVGGKPNRDLRSATPHSRGASWGARQSLTCHLSLPRLQPAAADLALPPETERRRSSHKTTCKNATLALSSPQAERWGDVFKKKMIK